MEKKYYLIGLVILLGMNILAWTAVYDLKHGETLKVYFFDVGQGDSEFIETPQGHQILIDGGPNSTVLEKFGAEMPFWDRTIDLIILTHPEKDHMAGLIDVLKRYKVENILWTGVVRDTPEYKEWIRLLDEEGANVYIAQAGEKILAGDAVVNILSPLEKVEGEEMENSNDSSVVAKLIYGQNSFLFTGDLTSSGETTIIADGEDVVSNVLKVGHHGSKTSTSESFLRAVSPIFAVIEVGVGNLYGHPTQEVLDRLENYDITVFRTDIDGDIKIISDGENLEIKSI